MSTRHVALALLSAGALFTAACGKTPPSAPSAAATTRATTAAAEGVPVVIDTFQFSPKRLQIHAGDTVVWTNHHKIVHTVTTGTREYAPGDSGRVVATHKDGQLDTPLDGPGATTSHRFTSAGTYHYFCDRHPGMEADVVVS